MWRTVKYKDNGKPLWDVNEQGKLYSYHSKTLIGKLSREKHPYYIVPDENGNSVYIHRLVAQAFPEICGEWFEGCEVHHKDGNSLNNEATNLIVCTKEEHWEYHRVMKEINCLKKLNKQLKSKNTIENYSKNYTVHFYCRKSKVSKKTGLAPVEISFYKASEKRKHFYLPFKAKPEDFKNKIYPEGFTEYINTLGFEL